MILAPYEPSAEEIAEWDRKEIEREQRRQDHERLVRTLRPLVARSFPGGWWGRNKRFVGEFNVEEFWREDADEPNFANMRVTCPDCSRRFAPFRSRSTISLGGGWRWVGIDHQEPYTEYFCACGWCGGPMIFTIYTPQ